ncbi:hypothetical protein VMCG_10802 [Cytospora schulzeri]|uniref:Zn(2)-C6 fungal-type domain-containing protein n=1 Tax=Cytospora schulzeri TaxID=448051 RepID=A0A423V7U8_9PEZI|nr:hypothetical protein VMCG_10802 [Valsa malicola]
MGRRSTACQTCKAIKTLCSTGNPCARCDRLSLPCHYAGPASIDGTSPLHRDQETEIRARRTPTVRTRAKTRHTKSATGCLSCRRRRKKCDERQPTCTDCERLHLTCIQPPQDTNNLGHRSGNGEDGDIDSESQPSPAPASSVTESFLKSDGFRAWVAVGDRPLASRLSTFSDWLALIETDSRLETVRTASLGNSTAAMMDLGQITDDAEDVVLATFLPSTALNNLTGVTAQSLQNWKVGERHLLNHFLQSVSRTMAVVEDTANPILHFIAPMALENSTVRHSLVALSACHLSKVYPVFEHDFCVARSQALPGLMALLDVPENCIWALTATLLLCLAEICAGNSRKWLLHLHGAKALLAQLEGGDNIIEPTVHILIELYNYLSCITSVTSDRVPGLFRGRVHLWVTDEDPESRPIHPLLGISTSLYESLARINKLAARRHQLNEDRQAELEAEAETIELELQSWQPFGCDAAVQSRSATEARAVAFAVQWAAIMRLQQVARRLENDDLQIKKASDNIRSALSLIRPGSEMEAHLLFPLFMAGVGSMTKASRLTVEYRLNVMETTIGFGNIFTAHRLLDEFWRRTNKGERLDWEELARTRYQGLVLF